MGVVTRQTLAEYFRELVHAAVERQQVETSETTEYYVVNLLARFVRLDETAGSLDDPLALRLLRALQTGGRAQREQLRLLGDLSLFVSGFFSDSLYRKVVDIDYYASLGGYAYGSLSQLDSDTLAPVFAELSDRFLSFVDVIGEVSEQTTVASSADLLRLYEKWLRTGSRRDGRRLIERGLVPNASIGQRFLQ